MPDGAAVGVDDVLYRSRKVVEDRTSAVTDYFAKFAARKEVWNMLLEGTWKKERVVGPRVPRDLIDAMMTIARDAGEPITSAVAEAWLKAQGAEKWDDLRTTDKVAAALKANAQSGDAPDLSDLLAS